MPYIDPESLYEQETQHYSEYWDDSLSLWQNAQNFLNECVILPDHDIQMPVVVAYSLVNQKWAKSLPILFLNGVSGSAKSQIMKFNLHLHQTKMQGADCTFVSLRNEIERQYYIDREAGFVRDGAMLLFDNAWERTFLADDKLLAMLLRSYEKSNAIVSVSSATFGENKEYCCFSPKIISSVSVFSHPKLHEIQRRIFVVRCKKLSQFTPEELENLDSFEPLDLDGIDFDGLYQEYYNFWNNQQNCELYVKSRGYLADRRRKWRQRTEEKYPFFSVDRFKICVDIISTMISTGYADEFRADKDFINLAIQKSIDALAAFYETSDNNLGKLKGSAEEIAREYIELHCKTCEVTASPEIINPKHLKQHFSSCIERGLMEEGYKRDKAIHELMHSLGWNLTKEGWVKL